MARAKNRAAAAAAAAQATRPEPTSKDNPVACDCLNWCGDDPWLKDGRARRCADFEKWQPSLRGRRMPAPPLTIMDAFTAECTTPEARVYGPSFRAGWLAAEKHHGILSPGDQS